MTQKGIRTTSGGVLGPMRSRGAWAVVLAVLVSAGGSVALLGTAGAQPALPEGHFTSAPSPTTSVYDPANHLLYVGFFGGGVRAYNAFNKLVATIPIPSSSTPYPYALGYDSTDHTIWVASISDSQVDVINATSQTVATTIGVGVDPTSFAFDPATNTMYVATGGSLNISVINASTRQVASSIDLSPNAAANLAWDPVTSELFATEFSANEVVMIDPTTNRVAGNVSVGSGPLGILFDPATALVYVANYDSGNISVIDPAGPAVVGWVTIPDGNTEWLTYDPLAGAVAVASVGGSHSVTFFSDSTFTVLSKVNVGIEPRQPSYDAANHRIYVPNEASSTVSYFSGTSFAPLSSVATRGLPGVLAFDPLTKAVYVADASGVGSSLTVVSTSSNTVVTHVAVGLHPAAIVFVPTTGDLYVANQGSDNVTVVNGTTNAVLGSVPTGSQPSALAWDPSNGLVYVADFNSTNLTVFNASTLSVSTDVAVGDHPSQLAYDPSDHDLWVANQYDGNISIVNPVTGNTIAKIGSAYNIANFAYSPTTSDMYASSVVVAGESLLVFSSAYHLLVRAIQFGPGFQLQQVGYDPANHDIAIGLYSGMIWMSPGSTFVGFTYFPPSYVESPVFDSLNSEMYVSLSAAGLGVDGIAS